MRNEVEKAVSNPIYTAKIRHLICNVVLSDLVLWSITQAEKSGTKDALGIFIDTLKEIYQRRKEQ